jgi:hypothetical protein
MMIAMQLTGIARPRLYRRKTRQMKRRIAAEIRILHCALSLIFHITSVRGPLLYSADN